LKATGKLLRGIFRGNCLRNSLLKIEIEKFTQKVLRKLFALKWKWKKKAGIVCGYIA
jgi:hypothetical protein